MTWTVISINCITLSSTNFCFPIHIKKKIWRGEMIFWQNIFPGWVCICCRGVLYISSETLIFDPPPFEEHIFTQIHDLKTCEFNLLAQTSKKFAATGKGMKMLLLWLYAFQTKARNPENTEAATNPVFDILMTSNDL